MTQPSQQPLTPTRLGFLQGLRASSSGGGGGAAVVGMLEALWPAIEEAAARFPPSGDAADESGVSAELATMLGTAVRAGGVDAAGSLLPAVASVLLSAANPAVTQSPQSAMAQPGKLSLCINSAHCTLNVCC